MTRHDRPTEPEEAFAAWLDALVDGKELPLPPRDGETERIEATARDTYQLASEARLTAGERRRIEEQLMASVHQPAARFTPGQLTNSIHCPACRAPAGRVSARPDHSPLSSHSRLTSIMSGALVAIMLLAIVAGYGVHNGWGPWHGDNQPTRIAAPAVAAHVPALPDPQQCQAKPLSNAELQNILTAPYEQRTNAINKNPIQVDVVDGAAILGVYEQIRDCAVSPNGSEAIFALMSPHAIQEAYWRGASLSGVVDMSTASSGTPAATPTTSSSAFTWQPEISKTDTYFAETHSVWMEGMKDGRVIAWLGWYNLQAQPLKTGSPLTGLVFIKIDGQWKLDDWVFGTQMLTDAGR